MEITITCDWGKSDYFFAAFEGSVYTHCPDARLVCINTDIDNYDILRCAYFLRNTYESFPKGTVHIYSVSNRNDDNEKQRTENIRHLLVEYNGYYFMGKDNGILPLVIPSSLANVFLIETSSLFPEKECFPEVVARLIAGEKPDNFLTKTFFEVIYDDAKHGETPLFDEDKQYIGIEVSTKILHIDKFGNYHTNLHRDHFNDYMKNFSTFKIFIRKPDTKITQLSENFFSVANAKLLALFNSNNYLIIAMNQAPCAHFFDKKIGDTIPIIFLV